MPASTPQWSALSQARALRYAVDRARRAPSVHNTQPWHFTIVGDAVLVRADRSRLLASLDPHGRQLVMSVGAALLNLRVGLAVRSWAVELRRLPDDRDPDVMTVVRAIPGRPEAELADLDSAIPRRRTTRRDYAPEPVPESLIDRLATAAAAEGATVVPVRSAAHRLLVADLTAQADRRQTADAAYRAELQAWTGRPESSGDGVPLTAVPRADGLRRTGVPLRNYGLAGPGGLPPVGAGADETLLLLTTPVDDPEWWLRAGEALERVLLTLTVHGYVCQPVTSAIEVPATRAQLRTALSWGEHPQMLLRCGRAAAGPPVSRRERDRVVERDRDVPPETVRAAPPPATARSAPLRPVPDGRGGTTWV